MTKDEASKQTWLDYHYHDDRIEAGLSPSQFGWSKYQAGFDAGYDFAKSESNDKAVIDGFLHEVDRRWVKGTNLYYPKFINEVYAEMFGKEGE